MIGIKRLLRKWLLQQPVLTGLLLLWVGLLWFELLAGQAFGQSGLIGLASSSEFALPVAQAHPLPPSLSQWQDVQQQGDYFVEVEPSPAGYLVWSQFPVQVYVEPADATDQAQQWHEAVSQAVQEWSRYLPLAVVTTADSADITIWRSAPPIQRLEPVRPDASSPNQSSSNQALIDRLPRIRAAETRYQFKIQRFTEDVAVLEHRFTIYLSPNQTVAYTQATARHELGHALGIWGHSPTPTDALYFAQVRDSPAISNRDISTLKRIYQQPTHLGWTLLKPTQQ